MNVLQIHGSIAKFGGASNGTKILCENFSKNNFNVFLCYNKKNDVLVKTKNLKGRLELNLSSRNFFIIIYGFMLILPYSTKVRFTRFTWTI